MSTTYGSEEGIDHWRWPDGDGCHDDCPACAEDNWMEEVAAGNTRLGFAEWLEHAREAKQDEQKAKTKVLLELLEQALEDAERLRLQTGDAFPGALCHTIRAAIAAAKGGKV